VKPGLGIIAGAGQLPGKLIAAAVAEHRPHFVIGIKGECDPEIIDQAPHDWVGIGSLGRLVRLLKKNKCEEVVFAGPVKRPSFKSLTIDWVGMRLLPKVLTAARQGDGALLSLFVDEMEAQGFRVVGAEQVATDLVAPFGTLGARAPSHSDMDDIAKGINVVTQLGLLDIGQSAVVKGGLVLGVEAAEGTDALLDRCGGLTGDGGGVLVKIAKPDQERRVDLPTVGVTTVRNAISAKLNGIAFEGQGTLLVDKEEALRLADQADLFLYGIDLRANETS
jgi:UDP-2,3-diacylglucosamine hydrolase